MTTVEATTSQAPAGAPLTVHRSWRVPIAYGVFTLAALLVLVVYGRGGTTEFTFHGGSAEGLELPSLPLGVRTTSIVTVVLALVGCVAGAVLVQRGRRAPLWLTTLFAADLLTGFLSWSAAGHTLPVVALLSGSLALSVPLIFGALGGVICERVGIVNIAIEAQLLAGAFVAAVGASATGSVVVGLVSAMAAGMLVSFVLSAFAIRTLVDQVIVGVVLNALVLGLTSFLYSSVLVSNTQSLNTAPQLSVIEIPVLSAIPVLGPVLFRQTVIVYLMYVAVAAVTFGLYKTRWGLRLRAVGEHPQAADTVGIGVSRTRLWNVALAGAVTGLGGAYYTLAAVNSFTKNITSGAGFIALAAVIFGRWNPARATLAALLFGFASNLQNVLGILGSPVPSDFLLMLPYVVTIFAVAGLVGQVRGPAAVGRPYVKG
ncbi:ABC transporter permease [Streptomyces sp. NBC_01275]|uniref:ABC transporter permease n=1 Tax=Streptomyces sp. NBC_01275 TaxID=2903807 RepID=UPI0022526845|nr:ABC transporter permease [Streptomyces sp. NBC_01275]MCX4767940.1 ABC transporter permease [Streptomyces sp. NBC_01275]